MSEDALASLELSSLSAPAQADPEAIAAPRPPRVVSNQSVLGHQGSPEGPTEVLPRGVHNLEASDKEKRQEKGYLKAQSALEV